MGDSLIAQAASGERRRACVDAMSWSQPRVLDVVPVSIAGWIAFYFVGLAWMIRIYRTFHLEPDASS